MGDQEDVALKLKVVLPHITNDLMDYHWDSVLVPV